MKRESFNIYYLIILIVLIITTIILGIGVTYNSGKIEDTLAMVSQPETAGGGSSSGGRNVMNCDSITYLVSGINEKNYFYTPKECMTTNGLVGDKILVTNGNFAFRACVYTETGNKAVNCGENQRSEMVVAVNKDTNENVYVYVCTEDAPVYSAEDKGDYLVCSQSYQGTVGPTLRYKYSMIAPYEYYNVNNCGDASNYSLLPIIDSSSDKKISACVKTGIGMNTPNVSCSDGSLTLVNVLDTLNGSNVAAYICRSEIASKPNSEIGPRLDYSNICANDDVKSAIILIGKLINIAMYAVPMIIIIFGVIDYIKASISNDEQALSKATKSLIKRIIAGVSSILIYTVLLFLLSALHLTDSKYLDNGEEYNSCMNCLLYPFNDCKKIIFNNNNSTETTNNNETTNDEKYNFIASSSVSGGSFSEPDKCVGEIRKDTVNIFYNNDNKNAVVTGCLYKRDYSADEIDVTCKSGFPTLLSVSKLSNNQVIETDEAFIYVCHSDLIGQGGGGQTAEGNFAGRK